MKRIILLCFFIILSISLYSCTFIRAETPEETAENLVYEDPALAELIAMEWADHNSDTLIKYILDNYPLSICEYPEADFVEEYIVFLKEYYNLSFLTADDINSWLLENGATEIEEQYIAEWIGYHEYIPE